jgi:putative Mg2+ transporter-C (MgtC) family protein
VPPQFGISTQDLIKVAISIVCGALLGFERQYKNKTAGFRTIMLICLGSALFTMVAQQTGQLVNINIVTGIGFIGAGVIFKDNLTVSGLTTAAVIWTSAAIGMAAGSGNYTLALISTVVTLLILLLFHILEDYIDKIHHERIFFVVFDSVDFDDLLLLEDMIDKLNLKSKRRLITKKDGCLQATLAVTGHKHRINKLDEKLLKMPQIKAF